MSGIYHKYIYNSLTTISKNKSLNQKFGDQNSLWAKLRLTAVGSKGTATGIITDEF